MQGINMKFMSKDNFLSKTQLPFQYPNSMLAAMFNAETERPPAEKDDNDHFFIDRDPEPFRVILGYLRNASLPDDIVGCSLQQVQWEASYYGLDGLLKIIEERNEAKEAEEEKKKTEEERETKKLKLMDYEAKATKMKRKFKEEIEKIRLCPAGCFGNDGPDCANCAEYVNDSKTYLYLYVAECRSCLAKCNFKEYTSMAMDLL